MSKKTEQDRLYAVIGKFLSRVNTIKLFTDLILEMIIESSTDAFNDEKEKHKLLDFFQQQNEERQVSMIKFLLNTYHQDIPDLDEITEYLDELLTFYNGEVRSQRNVIAHSPLMGVKYVSTRRYKKNSQMNNLDPSELEHVSDKLIDMIKKGLEKPIPTLQAYFNVVPKRKLS